MALVAIEGPPSNIPGGVPASPGGAADGGGALWQDAASVKEAVERLTAVGPSSLGALDDVKRQLRASTKHHFEFAQSGGIKALYGLLTKGNSIMQMKSMVALEALAANEDTRPFFRETPVVELILRLIRSSGRKPQSKRRQIAGEIIRLLAGCQPRSGTPLNRQFSSGMRRMGGSCIPEALFQVECFRERPLPLWYHTSNSILPWGTEAVGCLVDLLMSNVAEHIHDAAQRAIKKILHVSQFTTHIILEKRDIAALVDLITAVHPTAVLAMKVLTFVCIMHPSNEVTFVRTGGLEAIVQAMRTDALCGSVCGEMAAWTAYHFGATSIENAERLLEVGVADVLVETLQSPDYCCREAAARAALSILQTTDKAGNDGRVMFCEANAIPAILGVIQDGGYHSRQQEVLLDIIRMAVELAKVEEYRKEMLRAGAPETMNEGLTGCSLPVLEASKKLQKLLMSSSALRNKPWLTPMHQIVPPQGWMTDGCSGKWLQSVQLCFRKKESYRIHDTEAVAANALAGAPLDLGRWPRQQIGGPKNRQQLEWVEAWDSAGAERSAGNAGNSHDNLGTIDEHRISDGGLTEGRVRSPLSMTSLPARRGIGRHSLEPQDSAKGLMSNSLDFGTSDVSQSASQSDLFATRDFI
ncbi:unnamed protein product [Ostreobium quekettii]|uniref:Uncharacterized protein n=1 Tax=Ostreobium quekettii TaxID=121088 RepID=A0A8S1J192_9CHLO|nr:unnamed protein product [Ostreobium quekettii]|eukprot:evm.model.scf_424.7 EVM.evm.TU.scf_424.7   scf_424:67137-74012(+)